jgi:hypothetical protein
MNIERERTVGVETDMEGLPVLVTRKTTTKREPVEDVDQLMKRKYRRQVGEMMLGSSTGAATISLVIFGPMRIVSGFKNRDLGEITEGVAFLAGAGIGAKATMQLNKTIATSFDQEDALWKYRKQAAKAAK